MATRCKRRIILLIDVNLFIYHFLSLANLNGFWQTAEAEIDLLRIRKLRASIIKTVYGNPEALLGDFSELNETLAKLDRHDRRAFSRRKRALYALTQNSGDV